MGKKINIKKTILLIFALVLCGLSLGNSSAIVSHASIADEAIQYELGEAINGAGPKIYMFTIPEKQHVTFDLTGECNTNKTSSAIQNVNIVYYSVLSLSGQEIFTDDDISYNHNLVTGYSNAVYSRNLSQGTYYLKIDTCCSGNYNYSFNIYSEDVININKGVIKSVTSGSKKITVTIKDDEEAIGYEINYSTDKTFKKKVKKIDSASSKKVIKGLKSKTYYYVRVQPYALYSDGSKVYGNYSSIKKIKVK